MTSLKKIIKKISEREEIRLKPPVLIDIGASKNLNPIWKSIAPFSVGIAFDADERDFTYLEGSGDFKKLYIFNKIVTDKSPFPQTKFYLTESPYCSSLLEPDHASLQNFEYADFFSVKETVTLDVIELNKALEELKIDYIDWFKTDSQGIDLRLFASLEPQVQEHTLIAEFEPGFIDAYKGEDKITRVLAYMEDKPFFLSHFDVKGSVRMPPSYFKELFPGKSARVLARHTLKKIAGWAEMTYINKLEQVTETRELILSWLFSTLLGHHSIAYAFAKKGAEKTNDPFLAELSAYSGRAVKREVYSFRSLKVIAGKLAERFLR